MEEIAATGHNYVSLTVEPRCETQGCTQHGCTYCYDYYEDAFVPALGHNYQNGSCTRCGKTEPGSLDDSLVGDLDGVPGVAVDDAVYLLQHVLMPELFPVSQPADIDGNGQVNVDDAVYLLQHILMPELFPLYDKGTVLLPHSCLTFYRYLKGQGDGPLVSRDGITKKEHLPGCSFFVIALCLQLRFVRRRSA